MTEKILPYDHGVTPQETPWDCGPASTQVALNTRGVVVSETDLITEIGTTTRGTDYVGLVVPVLNNRLPDAGYTAVAMPDDPPTPAQRDALWADVVASIDAGYAVVINWVAPPSNYPRGVKGSVSPAYGGGTIYHYVAAMGYDDDPGLRALWIADPGFSPHGYWASFDQVATLIPPKGYAYPATAAAVAPMAAAGGHPDVAGLLSQVMGATVSRQRYAALAPAVLRCLRECGATSVARIAMWCAQVGHESVGLKYMAELWGPTPDQRGYEGRADLGNTVAGDGYRFRGRGPIQVTGRHNYTELSKWAHDRGLVSSPTFFVDHPDELAGDRYGFVGVTWYWTTQRRMNDAADAGDLDRATRYINGGLNGIADRRARYQRCLRMGDALLGLAPGDDNAPQKGGDTVSIEISRDEWDRAMMLLEQIADIRRPSRSPLRALNSDYTDTCAGYAWSADAYGHVAQLELLAVKYGDPQAVAQLLEVASAGDDPQRYPDRQRDADLAAQILSKVSVDAINAARAQISRWLSAENT